jgi:hypothetical protein
MRSLIPNSSMSTGTTITPPPTPMSPERMPVISPSTTSRDPLSQSITRVASREGTTRNRLTITVTRNPMKNQRSTTSESMCSSRTPIWAPTMAPAAMRRPAIQSTSPLIAYEMRPTTAVGKIAADEVPAPKRCENASRSTSRGTMTVPPPTPKRPERKPASAPMKMKEAMAFGPRLRCSVTGRCRSRDLLSHMPSSFSCLWPTRPRYQQPCFGRVSRPRGVRSADAAGSGRPAQSSERTKTAESSAVASRVKPIRS